MIPALVSSVMRCEEVNPWSATYFPTHRAPLPHIFASEPSALKILILKSAFSDGRISIMPSPPIPVCRSLSLRESDAGSSTVDSMQFI